MVLNIFILSEQEKVKLRKVQLNMLNMFIDICNKHNLKWFLVGGSALGAVRHQEFIPWDDDIDVAMPRHDYDIFSTEGQHLLPGHIFLQNHKTDPDYRNDFLKLRNNNTTFIESSCRHYFINHGVYIDIFPIDGYPDKKIQQSFFEFKKKIYKISLCRNYISDMDCKLNIKN